jgi:hypothetical protein
MGTENLNYDRLAAKNFIVSRFRASLQQPISWSQLSETEIDSSHQLFLGQAPRSRIGYDSAAHINTRIVSASSGKSMGLVRYRAAPLSKASLIEPTVGYAVIIITFKSGIR